MTKIRKFFYFFTYIIRPYYFIDAEKILDNEKWVQDITGKKINEENKTCNMITKTKI